MRRKRKYPFLCSWATKEISGEATDNPTEWLMVHNRIIIAESREQIMSTYPALKYSEVNILPFDYEMIKTKKKQ